MSFPDSYLHEGEDLVLNLKPHWWTFAKPGAFVLGAVVFAALVNVLTDVTFLSWVGWIVLLVALVNLAVVYGKWSNTFFVLSTDRLIFRTGVLSKSGVEISLDRINNVNFKQSLFERMIGAGDLLVESAGQSGQSRFSDVRKPDAVQNEIYRQLDQQRDRLFSGPSVSHGDASPNDEAAAVASKIEALEELRRKGLVTDEEFEAKRREILDRM